MIEPQQFTDWLTNSVTHQKNLFINSTQLNSRHFTALTVLHLGIDHTLNTVSLLLYLIVVMETCLFAKLLLSNGCCVFAYLTAVAQEGVYLPQCGCGCHILHPHIYVDSFILIYHVKNKIYKVSYNIVFSILITFFIMQTVNSVYYLEIRIHCQLSLDT